MFKCDKIQLNRNLKIFQYLTVIMVFLILLLASSTFASPLVNNNDDLYRPQIEPSLDEHELDINTNFKLTCASSEPVRWSFRQNEITSEIEEYKIEHSARNHGAQLTLNQVTADFVQFYYCVHANIPDDDLLTDDNINELEKLGRLAKIYIYVKDPKNLLVPMMQIPVVDANQDSFAIIPCRPSSRDVEVILESNTNDILPFELQNFDPKVGFKLISVTSESYLNCVATLNGTESHSVAFAVLLPRESSAKDLGIVNLTNLTIITKLTPTLITASSTVPITTFNILKKLKSRRNVNDFDITPIVTTMEVPTTNSYSYTNKPRKKYVSKTTIRPYQPSSEIPNTNEPFVHSVKITGKPFHGHVIERHPFNLTCSVIFNPDTKIMFEWQFRKGRLIEDMTLNSRTIHNNDTTATNQLSIVNSQKSQHSGEYYCIVKYSNDQKQKDIAEIKILDENEYYIDLEDSSKTYRIEANIAKSTRPIVINVDYKGYPHPNIEWKKNGSIIEKSDPSYKIITTDSNTKLEILHPQLKHSGEYEVVASNINLNKTLKYNVYLIGIPNLYMPEKYNVREGDEVTVECSVDSYPSPEVVWTWTPCAIMQNWPNCNYKKVKIFNLVEADNMPELNLKFDIETKTLIHQVHRLKFTPNEPGLINCTAKNVHKKQTIGSATAQSQIRVIDIPWEVSIVGYDDNHKIAVGDNFEMTCAAIAYDFSNDLVWYFNDSLVENGKDVIFESSNTKYSYQLKLKLNNIQRPASGLYECRAILIGTENKIKSQIEMINVYDPQPPLLHPNTIKDGSIFEKKIGDSLELFCGADGIPKPTIHWYKDEQLIDLESSNTTKLYNENQTLRIEFIKPQESNGIYKCLVANRLETLSRSCELKISDMPAIHLGWIMLISGVILVLLLFIIFLCIRVYKDQQIRKQLKEMRMENFESGAVEHINPALSLDEQAELLPYDKRFEFPREKLFLGKQLGAGAFGIVHKATAEGILPEEKETTVAVKMVKKTADNEVVRALGSELKIMVHLGQHLNVVNLLGAVTKNIFKRELMVIVEYCRYGNVQNFLLKNRRRYINQINPDTDLIDPNILTNEQRWSENDAELNSKNSSQGLRYVNLEFSNSNSNPISYNHANNNNNNNRTSNDPRPGTRGGRPNSRGYIRQSDLYGYGSQVDSAMTQQTMVHSIQDGEEVLSNNSVQPVWRSNYKSDSNDPNDVMEITTSHLVSWAFQVARGMDYLASRKVLHGDLAARNILLCEDNIVKICDFGLARSMYKNDNYKKDKDARLPIKWLALESLGDRVFSTRSDVWSFGIVLWEFFSLSKVPYPGMEADQSLYEKLLDGYRMEKPPYANQELYEIMLECWRANPESRPLFDELERRFAKLLGEEVTNHYLDLNEHYLRINADYQRTGQTDYLALMGSPDELAPAPPRYVNGNTVPEIRIDNHDYLKMNPKASGTIFSPRPISNEDNYVKADHFNFPEPNSPTLSNNIDSPMTKNRKKNSPIPEEIPMLARPSLSDSETEALSLDEKPSNAKKITNFMASSPQSQKSNEIQTTQLTGDDNYVNVKARPEPAPRKHHPSSNREAFTNPSYLILDNINEKKK